MKRLCSILAIAVAISAPVSASMATESTHAREGVMLTSADGARLGAIYRVSDDGSARLIVRGKMATIPASTLSMIDGKLTTSLTKSAVNALN